MQVSGEMRVKEYVISITLIEFDRNRIPITVQIRLTPIVTPIATLPYSCDALEGSMIPPTPRLSNLPNSLLW